MNAISRFVLKISYWLGFIKSPLLLLESTDSPYRINAAPTKKEEIQTEKPKEKVEIYKYIRQDSGNCPRCNFSASDIVWVCNPDHRKMIKKKLFGKNIMCPIEENHLHMKCGRYGSCDCEWIWFKGISVVYKEIPIKK